MTAAWQSEAPPWDEEPFDDGQGWSESNGSVRDEATGASWEPVDLGPHVDGTHKPTVPTILRRSDGQALLYPGRTHVFAGESESAKTWLALLAVAQVLETGGTAAFVDFEDDAAGAVERLRALSVRGSVIASDRFAYVRPDERISAGVLHVDRLLARRLDLIVVDGITEAMSLHGLSSKSDVDTATMQRDLLKRFALAGPAVIAIDHVVKDPETRGRYATGSQHKLAGTTGAQYLIEVTKAWAPGKGGRSRITVAKDRPGQIRAACDGNLVGDLVGHSWPDGRLDLEVKVTVPARPAADGGWRPTFYMEKISTYLANDPTADHSTRGVRAGVKGKAEHLDRALEVLVLEGYAERSERGGGKYHRHVKPYTEALDREDGGEP